MRHPAKYQAPGTRVRRRPWVRLWAVLVVCLMASVTATVSGRCAEDGDGPPTIEVDSQWHRLADAPADPVILEVVLNIPAGYHINADADQLGEATDFSPVPTSLRVVDESRGLTSGTAIFPPAAPMDVSFSTRPIMVFDGRLPIRVPISVSPSASPPFAVDLVLTYQACDEQVCFFPTRRPIRTTIDALPETPSAAQGIEDESVVGGTPDDMIRYRLFGFSFGFDPSRWFGKLLLLIMAMAGGVLLNLTPCVLPLIPIKLISLAAAAETDRRRSLALAGAMAVGIIGFWGGLGLFVSLLSGMVSANQMFQFPWFTIFIGVVIGVMATGLVWPPNVPMPSFLNRVNPQQHRLSGSFWIGVLTAVLSTPCTAPLMGAAMAWAVSQEPAMALLAFLAIGAGMASPYVLLTIWPAGVSRLPKSGPGSILMKQVMALLLMGAAAYFVGTGVSGLLVTPPEPPSNGYWWMVSACIAAAGGWLAVKCRMIDPSRIRRRLWTAVGAVTVVLALGMGYHLTGDDPVPWIYYTPARYARATSGTEPVVIVFTAEWCLNCKAIEQQVYRREAVVKMFAENRAIPMKVDLTAPNPDGRALLSSLGHVGIPLVAVWSPRGRFEFVSDFYSAGQLVEAVANAATP